MRNATIHLPLADSSKSSNSSTPSVPLSDISSCSETESSSILSATGISSSLAVSSFSLAGPSSSLAGSSCSLVESSSSIYSSLFSFSSSSSTIIFPGWTFSFLRWIVLSFPPNLFSCSALSRTLLTTPLMSGSISSNCFPSKTRSLERHFSKPLRRFWAPFFARHCSTVILRAEGIGLSEQRPFL